jgi:hypothetical protein
MNHVDTGNADILLAMDETEIKTNIRGAIRIISPSNPLLAGDANNHGINELHLFSSQIVQAIDSRPCFPCARCPEEKSANVFRLPPS